MMGEGGSGRDTTNASGSLDPTMQLYDKSSYSAHAIHMARTAMTANLMLSQMADQKASILMGATFVVFTIAVGQAANGTYQLSLLVLALSAFVSAMFAVAAVVPRFDAGLQPGQRPNLLFFGAFAQMEEDEYIDRLMQACEKDGRVLSTMLRDIHQNGMVLQKKKFRQLSHAYRSFQVGLIVTFAVFLYESSGSLVSGFG